MNTDRINSPMTYYFRRGSTYTLSDEQNVEVTNRLPGKVLILKKSLFGFYLEILDNFILPKKLYGTANRHADRILKTYRSRPNSTGVLLVGEKGSGKTLLTKVLSTLAQKDHVPTIIVNEDFCGDDFNEFMQQIDQECLVLFDEFEKVFSKEKQTVLLTLLDGVFATKKLFLFTCNDKGRIDQYMQNRPGRIFYMIEYGGLDVDFIREYAEDALNKDLHKHIDKICQISRLFDAFNFDLLAALVEEMNRYDEGPMMALEILNAKPTTNYNEYTCALFVGGKEVKDYFYASTAGKSPLTYRDFQVEYDVPTGQKDKSGDEIFKREEFKFEMSDFVSLDSQSGQITFQNKEGVRTVFSKKNYAKFTYGMLGDYNR